MTHLVMALLCFLLCVGSHLAACRVKKSLIFRSGFLLTLSVISFGIYIEGALFWRSSPHSLFFSSSVLFWLLFLWYFAQIVLLQYGSPSLTVVKIIIDRGERGADLEDFKLHLNNETLVGSRLRDLIDHGFVYREGAYHTLTLRGLMTLQSLQAYRKLMGRTIGG